MIDNVRGIVIGPVTREYAVYTPKGTMQGQPRCFETNDEAREWAEAVRRDAIVEVGPVCAKWLGWDGQWEMREYA